MTNNDWSERWARMEALRERAVSEEVARERGYDAWDSSADEPWVRELFARIPNAQWGATFGRLLRRAEIGGIIIPKHPVPGCAPFFAQLRPNRDDQHPVPELWPPRKHDHDHDRPSETADGRKYFKSRALRGKAREWHVGGKHGHDGIARYGKDEFMRADVMGEHEHPRDAKYLLAPAPWEHYVESHAHSDRTTIRHLESRRYAAEHAAAGQLIGDTPILLGEHMHNKRRKKKGLEQRLDVHPQSLRMLEEGAERAFFSIEGSIKADALLSAGEAAFAVPSITMWPALELERFAHEYLAGRRVYVVPDADWEDNPMVAFQAFVCCDVLKRHGVDAKVAASPGTYGAKGIDDFIAANGDVDDMVVVSRELTPEFHRWAASVRHDRSLGAVNQRERAVDVTRFLALHADDDGNVLMPGKTIAKHARLSLKQLDSTTWWNTRHMSHEDAPFTATEYWDYDHEGNLWDDDADDTERGLQTERAWWGRHQYQRDRSADEVWVWHTLTIRKDLRAKRVPRTVGDDV
jgi:hypothetical protein